MSITIRTKGGKGLKSGYDVEVIGQDGQPLHGIASADIRIRPEEIVTAELEVYTVGLTVDAEPQWMAVNPATGNLERVRRIEFESGDVWDANG